MKVIDLSVHLLEGPNIVYKGETYLKMRHVANFSRNQLLSRNIDIWLHAGTHVDAPSHAIEDGPSIETVELGRLVREAVLLNLTPDIGKGQPIDGEMLDNANTRLKESGEMIVDGDIIILQTSWSNTRRPSTPEYREHAPHLTEESAEWLVSRAPSAVGFDFPEEGLTKLLAQGKRGIRDYPLPLHRKILGAGIYLIEHLTNLTSLSKSRFLFSAAPLKIVGAEGTPVRAFAIE
jgi:kynurenine formamidase